MQTATDPTYMPGEVPPAVLEEPSRITYLRDNESGKKYPWSETLAERPGMVALDQHGRIVPNAPFMPASADPNADPSPSIDGVPRMSDIETLRGQLRTLQTEVAALRDQINQKG